MELFGIYVPWLVVVGGALIAWRLSRGLAGLALLAGGGLVGLHQLGWIPFFLPLPALPF